ncbi:major facilitator superfamily domain-containing protein [Lipomyces oligophaga]|uniref:major facilitator superfamily domain-containing protein n=1 Tax=Lipomyces oligophaga TaxID=45792 RepID=UPI0034CD8308
MLSNSSTKPISQEEFQIIDALAAQPDNTQLSNTQQYRSYRRRWYGLAVLMLLNFMASWDWLTFAPISSDAASFFGFQSESPINWLSTVILFTYPIGSLASAVVLNRRGVKASMLSAAIFLIVGNWIRVAGVRANDRKGSFGTLIFGQILIGLGQPFALNAPSFYSDMWFTSQFRVSANALASLSNPLGGAIGQLVSPAFVTKPEDIPDMVLWVSIIATIICIPTLIVPARPPLPPCPSSAAPKLPLMKSIKRLVTDQQFWIIFAVFSVLVGFFNSFSSLINQVMEPYGYTSDDAGIDGAVLIVAGLVFSAIMSPILDRTHYFLLALRTQVPIIAVCYICLIFTQTESRQLAGPYVVSGVLGAASFSLLPLALEFVQEQVFPVSPELTSSILWASGNVLGGIFIVIMDALKYSATVGSPPGNMRRSLIFQAVIASLTIPFPFFLKPRNKRVVLDMQSRHAEREVDSDTGTSEEQTLQIRTV